MLSTNHTSIFAFCQMRSLAVVALLVLLGVSVSHVTRGAATVNLPAPVKLNVPSTVVYGDSFGASLAIDGDFMVVGAPRTNVGESTQQGVVYLFARDAANPLAFYHIKTLTGADSYAYQGFGTAVAIHGDTIVVGAIHDDPDGHFDAGAAYVFQRNHGGADAWGEVAKLVDVNFDDEYSEHGYLGQSVAIHGDLIVVGAPRNRGRAFVFGRHQGGTDQWDEVQVLGPGTYWETGSFGASVAIDGQRIVVGGTRASMVPGHYNSEGAAFVYEHDGSRWVKVAKLAVADEDPETPYSNESRLGAAIAIAGETIFVGAPNMTINDVYGIGEVYAFQRDGSGLWPLVDTLTAAEAGAAASFGRALYAASNGLFISSDTGLDGNGMVHFFRYAGAQSEVNASAVQALQAWEEVYSFTTTEEVIGANVGSELAGSGNTLAIGANGYDGGRGSVFSYPLDVMLAVNPEATPTAEPPTQEPPTVEPPATGRNVAVYMPVVAGVSEQLPTQVTGELNNNGILAGPGGLKIGATLNTLTATVDIAMTLSAAPSEPLPSGVVARSEYFRLSGEYNLLVDMDSPFVVSLPVPAGVDTAHLALAHLQPLAEIMDTHLISPTGNVWSYLPGAYDADHNLFLAKLPFLSASGATLVLAEHPDIESPLNGAPVQMATSTDPTAPMLQHFSAHCMTNTFPQADDCTPEIEADVETFMDVVYLDMVRKFGFPSKLRLLDASSSFIVSESYSATALTAVYSIYLLHKSDSLCKGSGGMYTPETAFLGLCLEADETLNPDHTSILIHELFHAIEYTYPKVMLNREQRIERDWILEGMAQAAEKSYYSTTMARSFRFGEDNLHKVDIQLTTGKAGDEYLDEYLAQDFWVYLGQSKPDDLGYLGTLLSLGGSTTQGIADAMKLIDNTKFADTYWGWVKNQVIENTYGLGGGPGQICQLTDEALTNGQHDSFPSHMIYYPPFNTYQYLAPLSAAVVEILIPHTDTGLIVYVGYEECDGLADPAARQSCRIAAQQHFHAKIYEEGESFCSGHYLNGVTTEEEGYRWLQPIREGKRYFVLVANADLTQEHGFYIALE